MTKPAPTRRLLALLPLALLLLAPATAAAADSYESTWNGGHLTATANVDFTEATIESVSVGFDGCGTQPAEATCAWNAKAILYSHADRCDPATPEEQVVWDSGWQSGNGTVTDGPISFALEGCRGQTLLFRIGESKSYEESSAPPPWVEIEGASLWPLFTFGYHPVAEEEQRIINASPPASLPPFEPNFTPQGMRVASGCRSLTVAEARYVFAFKRMGCWKASMLAQRRYSTGAAPDGYACRQQPRGVRCWREGQPQKYLEWHLPGTKPVLPRA